jgi:hypothetical protein
VEKFYYWFNSGAIAHDAVRQENIVKKPAPLTPVQPPDAPEKRVRETENVDEGNPALAAKKRLEALEAIKRSQSSTREQTNGKESDEEKTGSQDQISKK